MERKPAFAQGTLATGSRMIYVGGKAAAARDQEASSARSGRTLAGAASASCRNAATILSTGSGWQKW